MEEVGGRKCLAVNEKVSFKELDTRISLSLFLAEKRIVPGRVCSSDLNAEDC